MTFKSIEDLYNRFPWRTPSKFVPLAKRYGFNEKEAREYLKNNIIHDVVPDKPKYMNIYSKHPGGYQMDTFINNRRKNELNYLMFININTRKAYSYPLVGKGAKTIIEAFNKFIDDVKNVYSITSDQDPAYLSNEFLDYIKSKNIIYRTTEDNNHNVLGIINRFMRTIRDMIGENRYIAEDEMKSLIEAYNETPHKSLNNRAPNDITENDEMEYIKKMSKNNPYDYKPDDRVRIVNIDGPSWAKAKRRSRVSKEAYIVDSKIGNQFMIKAKDKSVDKYPGYQLVKTDNKNIAETLKDGKRGIIDKITGYNKKSNQYQVIYEGGVKDKIAARNLREGNPAMLSRMEREYWSKQSTIPPQILKWS